MRLSLALCAFLGLALCSSAQAQSDDQGRAGGSSPIDVPNAVSSGVKLLEGFVGSILNPTASEFRKFVKEGKTDAALALYGRQSSSIKGSKDLEPEVASLLATVRARDGSAVQAALDRLVAARRDQLYLQDLRAYKARIDALSGASSAYTTTQLIADFAAGDPLVREARIEQSKALDDLAANAKQAYRNFPHEAVAFSAVVPELRNESELFRDALPSIAEKLKTLDDASIQAILKNTSSGWSADSNSRAQLAEVLMGRFAPNADPVPSLRAARQLEKFGLRASDAARRPKVLVFQDRAEERGYTFSTSHDGTLKSAAEAHEALRAQDRRAIVVRVLESSTNRRIVEKRDIESKHVSGQRNMPNPGYEVARINCHRAQSDAATQKMKNAVSPGTGWGAVLQGLAEGIASSNAEKVCQQFAATPPYTQEDVLAAYSYVVSRIEVTKRAAGWIIALDPVSGGYETYPFNTEDKYVHPVAYGRRDSDRGGGTVTATDAELEVEIAAPLKLDAEALVMSTQAESKQRLNATELSATLSEGRIRPQVATTDSMVTVAANARSISSATPPISALAAARSIVSDASSSEARMPSVVVVLNPKGSLGAGFYVDSRDVLTNYHVIEGASTVELRGVDGTLFSGRVVRTDIQLDLALVRVERPGPSVQFANTVVRAGATVDAIGHPKGLSFSLTRGIVSAVRQVKGALAPGGDNTLLIQTDTPINPGNSGGPLFLGDKVVGINTMKFKASEGIGFALHYSEVLKFLSQ